MITNIGSCLLIALSFSSFLFGFIHSFKPAILKRQSIITAIIILILIIICFLLLVYAFITSDFSVSNVYYNSSTIKPLIYKISAAWASHEGSMLLWVFILSIITLCFIRDSYRVSSLELKLIINRAIGIQFLLISSFLWFIILTSNPFLPTSGTFSEGRGLNPVLQDVGLAIHPPILYLGYISYSIAFSMIISLLIKGELDKDFLKFIKKYSLIGWISLSSGVALGGWWAYRVLGWGGYWFFDPVENISLIPWLAGTAFHHSIIATIKRSVLNVSTLLLGIISFLLCFLGTFLVRSGIITSVHTFATDTYRGAVILIFFSLFTVFSLSLFTFRAHHFYKKININYFTREGGILIGNITLALSFIVLLCGTFYPLFIDLIYNQQITVEPKFFIKTFIPLLLPSILLSSFLGFSAWGLNDNLKLLKKSFPHIFLSVIFTIIYLLNSSSILGAICILVGAYTSFYCCFEFIKHFKTASIGRISMTISHLGIGLILVTMTIYSTFASELIFVGKINDKYKFKEHIIVFQNLLYSEGTNYYRQIAKLLIEDERSNEIVTLTPEIRLYKIENNMISTPSIYSTVFYDYYAVINKVKDNELHATIYHRPCASLVLLSAFVMISGAIISLLCKKSNSKIKVMSSS